MRHGCEQIMTLTQSKLSEQDISELASFFDLLAKFDFEDAQKRQVILQEVEKGFSLDEGKPFLESCNKQDKETS